MKAVTLRNIPSELAREIERQASAKKNSINRTILSLLAEKLGVGHKKGLHHDLDALAGCWSKDEAAVSDKALAKQRPIDSEIWE